MSGRGARLYQVFEAASATVIVMSMVVVLTMQVFFRYVLKQPLYWSEELARFLMIWSVFFGAVFAFNRGSHLSIDILVQLFPKRIKAAALLLTNLIIVLFNGLLVVIGIRFTLRFLTILTPALSIPLAVVYAVLPITGVLNILVVAAKTRKDVREVLCS